MAVVARACGRRLYTWLAGGLLCEVGGVMKPPNPGEMSEGPPQDTGRSGRRRHPAAPSAPKERVAERELAQRAV